MCGKELRFILKTLHLIYENMIHKEVKEKLLRMIAVCVHAKI